MLKLKIDTTFQTKSMWNFTIQVKYHIFPQAAQCRLKNFMPFQK